MPAELASFIKLCEALGDERPSVCEPKIGSLAVSLIYGRPLRQRFHARRRQIGEEVRRPPHDQEPPAGAHEAFAGAF
ncbi:MAG: hypothetical protein ACLUEQ_04460 [Cloacibacillus evryensis]